MDLIHLYLISVPDIQSKNHPGLRQMEAGVHF